LPRIRFGISRVRRGWEPWECEAEKGNLMVRSPHGSIVAKGEVIHKKKGGAIVDPAFDAW
jgi:hypothetical protein